MSDELQLALLDCAAMARADRAMIAAGTPGLVLMERAGKAVADAVSRRARPGVRVLVLCGPGNNGGDGFVAARILRERGLAVTLALAGDAGALKGDPAAMAGRWKGAVAPVATVSPAEHGLIVDALFGAGLNRPLDRSASALVDAINAANATVISVDVPSGLSGDSGKAEGACVRAAETVTFFRLKPGHLLQPGRGLCGVVTLADIGIRPEIAFASGDEPRTFRNDPLIWRNAWPRHDGDVHKYRRGSVLVLADGLAGVGAPRLGARAALRIGAGLVTIACRPEALGSHAARGPDALMQRPVADAAALQVLLDDKRLGAVLAGPALGLDDLARAAVAALLRSAAPAVLDADALTLLSRHETAYLRRLFERRGAPCVLTPHEGEFTRLLGSGQAMGQETSKLERARLAASALGVVLVLKGSDTVIAAPDGRAAINTTGSAALATAGSGDVLGGLIAGLLAQGMPAFEAACSAVWLHGRAGEALGFGLIADDLPEAILPLLAIASSGDAPGVRS